MAITWPITDLFTAFEYQPQSRFYLSERQELSTFPSGLAIAKDFGSAMWRGEWLSIPYDFSDLGGLEARMLALRGALGTFMGCDPRRSMPLAYPTGAFADSGVINAIGGNNRSMSLKSLPAGFVLSAGDYLEFTYSTTRVAYHRVLETVTANGSGTTPTFDVAPYIQPGAAADIAVKLKNPHGLFQLIPGSFEVIPSDDHISTVAFKGVQVL